MIRLRHAVSVVLLGIVSACSISHACSTVCLKFGDRVVCGRNMDFVADGGVIAACPAGIEKVAISPTFEPGDEPPLTWRSKYATVTFSLVCRELPSAGMNECGLVINEMTLDATKYPDADRRPPIVPLQWIQFHLDNCATVDDVLNSQQAMRTAGFSAVQDRGHHFLLADALGNTAIVEFINGKRVVHRPKASLAVLTNSPYSESQDFLARHQGFGGNRDIQISPNSMDRFVCLADKVSRYKLVADVVPPVAYSFESLAHVSQGGKTVWTIVFDATGRQIYYRTSANANIRRIDAADLLQDLQKVKVLQIENPLHDDVTDSLIDYKRNFNREHPAAFFSKFMSDDQHAQKQKVISFISDYLDQIPFVLD